MLPFINKTINIMVTSEMSNSDCHSEIFLISNAESPVIPIKLGRVWAIHFNNKSTILIKYLYYVKWPLFVLEPQRELSYAHDLTNAALRKFLLEYFDLFFKVYFQVFSRNKCLVRCKKYLDVFFLLLSINMWYEPVYPITIFLIQY